VYHAPHLWLAKFLLKNQLMTSWKFPWMLFVIFLFSSVQPLSRVWLFVTPWIAARQASLSITNSQSSLKFMSIESVMPSSHLILCCSLLLLPPIPPSIRVFSNESTLRIRCCLSFYASGCVCICVCVCVCVCVYIYLSIYLSISSSGVCVSSWVRLSPSVCVCL